MIKTLLVIASGSLEYLHSSRIVCIFKGKHTPPIESYSRPCTFNICHVCHASQFSLDILSGFLHVEHGGEEWLASASNLHLSHFLACGSQYHSAQSLSFFRQSARHTALRYSRAGEEFRKSLDQEG